MHGRVKVKSTAQQQEEKRIEREGKLKSYRFASLDLTLLPLPLEEELLFWGGKAGFGEMLASEYLILPLGKPWPLSLQDEQRVWKMLNNLLSQLGCFRWSSLGCISSMQSVGWQTPKIDMAVFWFIERKSCLALQWKKGGWMDLHYCCRRMLTLARCGTFAERLCWFYPSSWRMEMTKARWMRLWCRPM